MAPSKPEPQSAESASSTTASTAPNSRPAEATEEKSHAKPGSSSERPEGASGEEPGEGEDSDLARCPICQFIEAGECGDAHKEWVRCRGEAKAAGKDYIDECQDKFKTFLQCAVTHRDYYEPFLEMLGGVPGPEDEGEQQGGQEAGGEEEEEREGAGAGGGEGAGAGAGAGAGGSAPAQRGAGRV
ncbi:hypothetical protein HYH02_014646 [Chlamydomonas schloesseri]|uniref:GCK domain-containing protein n=1 Tax=Chlamydomonas schloesseri TaxID=2026947 RepID=A0A835VS55_9CHLO|nr:hypothetical protein HYH02_014646 [Chlamydomonas schloesseri]|eukprot:KAG2427242.1 hypothetical protein HYH02_014646 [Chlamydomonas schloesseri]